MWCLETSALLGEEKTVFFCWGNLLCGDTIVFFPEDPRMVSLPTHPTHLQRKINKM